MLLATVSAGLLIAQQVAAKATRDALFLSSFSAAELPKAMALAALLSLGAVAMASRGYVRFGPGRVVPALLSASAALYVVEWWLLGWMGAPVAWLVFLHVAVFGVIVVSGFWSVVNERFDPHAAKPAVARIGIGATAGGVLGGLGSERLVAMTDLRTTLLALALINGVAALGVAWTGVGTDAMTGGGDQAGAGERNGLRVLGRSAYLKQIALLVALVSLAGTLLDWALKAGAAATFPSERELMSFFAFFYTAMSLGTLALQTLASRPLLERLGIAGTVAILPGIVLLFSAVALAVPQVATLAAARGAGYLVENSLFRSGYELLYTPLPAGEKRATKALVDVGFDRLGDAVGSGVILAVLALVVTAPKVGVLGLVLVACVAAFVVALRIHRTYVSQLAASLRAGTLELDSEEIVDATTRRTLTETTMALDREKLLAEIQEFRARQRDEPKSASSSTAASPAPRTAPTPPSADDPVLGRLVALVGGKPEAARAVLRDGPLDPPTVAFALRWLGRRETEDDALGALRAVAHRHVGQLIDALLDPDQPFVVRRRLPRVLRVVETQRCVDGLVLALDDARFEVRYQVGRALGRILDRHDHLHRDRDRLFAVVHRELDVGADVWRGQRLLDPADSGDDEGDLGPASIARSRSDRRLVGQFVQDRVDRSLEHVFNLLGLALDPETVALSYRALGSDDSKLRGTALEYLDNVLPPSIRSHLWPHIDTRVHERRRPSTRQREEIVEDLLRSAEALPIDRRALDSE